MNRADDLALLTTYLETRMSPESIAMLLGRRVAWVLKESAALAAAEAAPVTVAPAMGGGAVRVETIPALRARTDVATDRVEFPVVAPRPAPTRATPRPYLTPNRRPRGASIGPRLERLAIRIKDVSDRVARWAWWFVAAGWEVGEVADLFDVDARELARRVMALDGGMI